jgi:phenylalanyl-tRNA synthetase alpha subunit
MVDQMYLKNCGINPDSGCFGMGVEAHRKLYFYQIGDIRMFYETMFDF